MADEGRLEDVIRHRAYEIWEAEGRAHGQDMEHWLQAERELGDGPRAPTEASARKPRKRSARPARVTAGPVGDGAAAAKAVEPPKRRARSTATAAAKSAAVAKRRSGKPKGA